MTPEDVVCSSCGSCLVEHHGERISRVQTGLTSYFQDESLWWCHACGRITHTPYIEIERDEESSPVLRTGRFAGKTYVEVAETPVGLKYLQVLARTDPSVDEFLRSR